MARNFRSHGRCRMNVRCVAHVFMSAVDYHSHAYLLFSSRADYKQAKAVANICTAILRQETRRAAEVIHTAFRIRGYICVYLPRVARILLETRKKVAFSSESKSPPFKSSSFLSLSLHPPTTRPLRRPPPPALTFNPPCPPRSTLRAATPARPASSVLGLQVCIPGMYRE